MKITAQDALARINEIKGKNQIHDSLVFVDERRNIHELVSISENDAGGLDFHYFDDFCQEAGMKRVLPMGLSKLRVMARDRAGLIKLRGHDHLGKLFYVEFLSFAEFNSEAQGIIHRANARAG